MDVLTDKMLLYEQLTRWETAIQPLLSSLEHQQDCDKLMLLRIHNRLGLTLLESSLCPEERLLDSYQWALEDIINYGDELQKQAYRRDDETSSDSDSSLTSTSITKHQRRCFFILDTGIIFALYWAALKSRDGLLRRRAISLLYYSTQEGIWNGPIQAAIAKRIIEIEEDQPYEQNPPPEQIKRAEHIPEYIRVHSVETEVDKMRRTAKLLILQRLHGDEGGWDERIEWVRW